MDTYQKQTKAITLIEIGTYGLVTLGINKFLGPINVFAGFCGTCLIWGIVDLIVYRKA